MHRMMSVLWEMFHKTGYLVHQNDVDAFGIIHSNHDGSVNAYNIYPVKEGGEVMLQPGDIIMKHVATTERAGVAERQTQET